MNSYGGGLIIIINYGSPEQAEENENAITTESGINILTEASQNILT